MRVINRLIIACLVLLPSAAVANDSQPERASLTGLTAMSVVVEDLSPGAEKTGLARTALETDVQRRLRQAGISLTPDADAYIYIHVVVADPGGALPLAYLVEVSLRQEVTLPRGIKTRTPVHCQTWWLSTLGMAGSERVKTVVSERVGEFVDQFIRAYQSVNPKA